MKKAVRSLTKTSPSHAFFELIRATNCVMASVAVAIAYMAAQGSTSIISMLIAMVATFCICAGGQAINDYYDAAIDAKLHKNKPIPSKRITKIAARNYALVLYAVGFLLAMTLNTTALLIAAVMIVLLTVYSAYMSRVKYLGNIVVALGTAITFIFGASAANNLYSIALFFFATAFFSNLAREITKDLEDMKKDKGVKKTLPFIIGEKKSRMAVFLFHIIAGAIAIETYLIYHLNALYLVVIILSIVFFGIAVQHVTEKKYYTSQQDAKKGMAFSLLAFLSSLLRL